MLEFCVKQWLGVGARHPWVSVAEVNRVNSLKTFDPFSAFSETRSEIISVLGSHRMLHSRNALYLILKEAEVQVGIELCL